MKAWQVECRTHVPFKALMEVGIFGTGGLAWEFKVVFFIMALLLEGVLEGWCVEVPCVELATNDDADVEWKIIGQGGGARDLRHDCMEWITWRRRAWNGSIDRSDDGFIVMGRLLEMLECSDGCFIGGKVDVGSKVDVTVVVREEVDVGNT